MLRLSTISKVPPTHLLAYVTAFLMVVGGCGSSDNLNRQAISGTITLDGKPLTEGTIRFTPDASGGGATTDVATTISNGAYSFSRSDGPVPGSYKVTIDSIENTPFEAPQDKMPGEFVIPPRKQQVPAKYNVRTTLTATVKDGQNPSIDFSLTTK